MSANIERLPQVCDRCRIKKIGCDGVLPSCGKCTSAGVDCVVSASLRRKTQPRRFGKSKTNEVQQLRSQISALKEALVHQRHAQSTSAANEGMTSPATAQDVVMSGNANTLDGRTKTTIQQQVMTSDRSGSIIRHLGRLVPVGTGLMFAGSTTGVHFIRSVEQKWQSLSDLSESFSETLFRLHALPQTTMLYPPASSSQALSVTQGSVLQLSKEYYLARVQRFLMRWSTTYPIFCRRQLFDSFTKVLDQRSGSCMPIIGSPALYQLLLVLSIDAWDALDLENDVHALHYYNAARTYEPEAFHELHLEAVQAHILNAIFLQLIGKHGPLAAAVGAAVRAAQCIGLHRHPRRFKICAGETELRTRLWWCISILDISVSIAYGLPKIINDTDVDVVYPTNCDFDDMKASELPVPLPGESTEASMFISLAKLSAIMQQMTRMLFTTTERREGEAKIHKLDRQLRVWQYEHVESLEMVNTGEDRHSFSRRLQVLSHFCMLLIHQPGLTFEEENSQFPISMAASLRSALDLLLWLAEFKAERTSSYLQPNWVRMIFQSGLMCLYYAWHNQTVILFSGDSVSETPTSRASTTLAFATETAVDLLRLQISELPTDGYTMTSHERGVTQQALEQAILALQRMTDKTYALFDGSNQHPTNDSAGVDEGLASMDTLEDWSSSLWQLNADDLTEWSEAFAFGSMDTFLPDFDLE